MTVIGDGRPENEFVIVGDKLWKEKALLKMSEELPTPSPIKETKDLLSERIYRYTADTQDNSAFCSCGYVYEGTHACLSCSKSISIVKKERKYHTVIFRINAEEITCIQC